VHQNSKSKLKIKYDKQLDSCAVLDLL